MEFCMSHNEKIEQLKDKQQEPNHIVSFDEYILYKY